MRALVILLLLITFVGAQNFEDDSLRITLVNQEPDPVGPGEYVDVRLQIENLGDVPVNNVMIDFMPEFPFTLDPGENKLVEIGTLGAFQNQDRAFIVKYKLRISDDAVEGTNELNIRLKKANEQWSQLVFDINVRTADANLAIESVTTTPSEIEPGKDATVTVKVKNMADSVLRDVRMNLDLSLATITAAANLDSLPFATLDSGTEKSVSQIAPGQEHYFTYSLRAYPTAESRVYKIPVQVEYRDELNTQYTVDSLIGLVVNSKPDVTAILDSTEIESAGTKGEVSIRFVNKGLTDIKFVNVVLSKGDDYDIFGSSEVYIGNIDSDDYETADYDVFVKDTASGDVVLPITYTYMDANNNGYTIEDEIELRLFTEEDNKKFGNGDSNKNTIIFVLVVVVLIVAFIAWRIYKRCRA